MSRLTPIVAGAAFTLAAFGTTGSAAPITILTDTGATSTGALPGNPTSLDFSNGGVTLTVEGVNITNGNADNFAFNAPNDALGVSGNQNAFISNAEGILLSFDTPVFLEAINLVNVGNNQARAQITFLGTLTILGASPFPTLPTPFDVFEGTAPSSFTPLPAGATFNGGGNGGIGSAGFDNDVVAFSPGVLVNTGETVLINGFGSSDNVGLQGVTVSVIPEPASAALVVAGGLCLLPRRRRGTV